MASISAQAAFHAGFLLKVSRGPGTQRAKIANPRTPNRGWPFKHSHCESLAFYAFIGVRLRASVNCESLETDLDRPSRLCGMTTFTGPSTNGCHSTALGR